MATLAEVVKNVGGDEVAIKILERHVARAAKKAVGRVAKKELKVEFEAWLKTNKPELAKKLGSKKSK